MKLSPSDHLPFDAVDASGAREQVADVVRASYGRLIAVLAAGSRDIELAEDVLADALEAALRRWPVSGIPHNPEAWILVTARNRMRDHFRSAAYRSNVKLEEGLREDPAEASHEWSTIPDERLALLFACAHPAVDASIHTPLMLQVVLGVEAKRIADVFAIPASAMAQRLVRAKRRIRDAGIPFTIPEPELMPSRLPPVLEAIYGGYAIDWMRPATAKPGENLAEEARYLALALVRLLDDEPEVLGLAALLSLSMARSAPEAEYVPLEDQDASRWDHAMIAEGEMLLKRAHSLGRAGRFQIEAAIQSVHCARATTGVTDWRALQTLYDALIAAAPSLGACVAHAVAVARVEGAAAGLRCLDAITEPGLQRFQPAWAARAHLLDEAGRFSDAARAYEKAISLTTPPGARSYLQRRLEAIEARG